MKKLIYLASIVIIFISCVYEYEEEDVFEILGTYSGTFTVIYENESYTNPVTVTFYENGRYESTSSDDGIPAGGSGTFTYDDSKITFEDENIWTADFDWNLILNGEYMLENSDSYLNFSANKNGIEVYEYNLSK